MGMITTNLPCFDPFESDSLFMIYYIQMYLYVTYTKNYRSVIFILIIPEGDFYGN